MTTTKWRSLIIFATIVVAAVAASIFGTRLAKRTRTVSLEEGGLSAVEAPTAVEETPQTSKVVLDEAETSSGETFKSVSGRVSSVSGRTVILEAEGDRLEISVAEGAKINRTTLPRSPDSQPEVAEITLDQIQAGQQVDALVKIEGGRATATNLNVIIAP